MTGDILNKIYIESGLTGVDFAKLLGIGRTKLYGLFDNATVSSEIIKAINGNEQLKQVFEHIKKEQKNDKKHEVCNPNALQDAYLLTNIETLKIENNKLTQEIIELKRLNLKLFEQNNKLIELITKLNK